MSLSQRPSMGARENRKQMFDANYIASWLNGFFPTLNVIPEHITKPTADDIFDIYAVIAQHILNLPTAVLTMPPFDADGEIDIELFSRATPKLVVFKSLSAFIEDLTEGQNTLTLNDLLTPNPRSTRRLLSVLIDYIQFSQEINKEVNRVFAIHDDKRIELERRRNAVMEMEHEVASLRSEHQCRKHDENEKRAELEQLYQKTRQIIKENGVLQNLHQTIVKDVTEKTKRTEEVENELKSLTILNEMLTSKLVTSPDRLESDIKEAIELREVAIKEADAKRRELNAEQEKQQQRAFIHSAIVQLEEHLQHISSYEAKVAAVQEKLSEIKRFRSIAIEELKSQQNMVAKERDALNECEVAFEREQEKHLTQLRNYHEQITVVQSHVDEMRRRLDDVKKENVEVQREIGKLKDDLSMMNRKAEAESTKMAHRLRGVLEKLHEAKRAYNEEYSMLEGLINAIEKSRCIDGQEHSDSMSLTAKNPWDKPSCTDK